MFDWLTETSVRTLSRGYEDIPEDASYHYSRRLIMERFRFICEHSAAILNLPSHTEKLWLGFSLGWPSLSSPVISNFGREDGLPIACNGTYIGDEMVSILRGTAEIGMMSKYGAGTSCFIDVRGAGAPFGRNGKASGVVPVVAGLAHNSNYISQGGVRRGYTATYVHIEHPDIHEFLRIADHDHPIQEIKLGVVIPDAWMEEMVKEPAGGEKRQLLATIVLKRRAKGTPYIFFTDNANNARHPRLREIDLKIHATNLCTEIMLPSGDDESFVCNLASVNLTKFDEWKDTDFVQTMIYTLDAVMSEYIEKTETIPFLDRAHNFAKRWRALGLGVLGYHSALQQLSIPFESQEARDRNILMHRTLGEQSVAASIKMAQEYGEAPGMEGTGQRHLTTNAIAPTKTSSIIFGQVSEGINLRPSNVYENDNAKGVYTQVSDELRAVLAENDKDTREVWNSIILHGGSVQHLDWMSDHDKAVFKTANEISQREVIQQAADRGEFIDQGQSLNLMVDADASMNENVQLIYLAWRKGLKSLYYHDNSGSRARETLRDETCLSCEA